MLPRDGAVHVDSLGRAPDHRLEVLPEVGGLELGIKLAGEIVTQILGILRVVVTADTPRILVFGKVSGDELDGVEGVGFAGLTGRKDSAVNGLLGDLNTLAESPTARLGYLHSCVRSSPR